VTSGAPLSAAVFASGGGTNLQRLLDHQAHDPPWRIRLVVSDRAEAGALGRAEAAGVPTRVVPTRGRPGDEVAAELLFALDEQNVALVFLAGYLKRVPAPVVAAHRRRILNIHPALLPGFGGKGMYGMHVHRAVLDSGARVSGPTVHWVDEEYDRGPILAQWPVPVLPDDTPETLAARVLEVEHLLYPRVADHVADAVLAGEEAGPLSLPGGAFALVDGAGQTTLARGPAVAPTTPHERSGDRPADAGASGEPRAERADGADAAGERRSEHADGAGGTAERRPGSADDPERTGSRSS
jgi:formyltetrahydrofolate-dependent phosphoribosylglycinamide formyltransferase